MSKLNWTLSLIPTVSSHTAILIFFPSSGLRQDQAVCHWDEETNIRGGDDGWILWLSGNLHWYSCGCWCSLHLWRPLQHPRPEGKTINQTSAVSFFVYNIQCYVVQCLSIWPFDRPMWSTWLKRWRRTSSGVLCWGTLIQPHRLSCDGGCRRWYWKTLHKQCSVYETHHTVWTSMCLLSWLCSLS